MKLTAFATAFLAAALLLAACGGSSDDAPRALTIRTHRNRTPVCTRHRRRAQPPTHPARSRSRAHPGPRRATAAKRVARPPAPDEPPDEPEPDPTPEPRPFPDDVILAYQHGSDVWIATADGETHQVTFDFLAHPNDWSPDGTRLLVAARPDGLDGTRDLYLLDGLGAEPVRITDTPNQEFWASFSPDGSLIAVNDFSNTINFLSLDSSPSPPAIELDDPAAMFGFQYLRWSPDGSRFVLVLLPELEWRDIYVMNVDGTALTRLRPPDDFQFGEYRFVELEPEWSPDGTQIVFASDPHEPFPFTFSLWIMNADGSDRHQLTPSGSAPSWSPDGAQIAFVDRTGENGSEQIWILDLATDEARVLTNGRQPRWRPLP